MGLIGGPERVEVSLHSYDGRWPDVYLTHRHRIQAVLASTSAQIENIGSTAVPGLAAKPIIDIVVAVEDITAEVDYLAPLLAAGYELRVLEPGHRLKRTRPGAGGAAGPRRARPRGSNQARWPSTRRGMRRGFSSCSAGGRRCWGNP